MDDVLVVDRVSRKFGEDFYAVKDVSFSVNAGKVLGVLGPNGAGKTTIMKMCSTLLLPSSGDIFISGVDVVKNPRKARGMLGISLGGSNGFYMKATVQDNLKFFADIDGIKHSKIKTRVQEVIDLVGLNFKKDAKVQTLSMGLLQRLHLARSLLKNPSLLLLDEPTNGLDPEIAVDMLKLVSNIADSGTAIVLTTHTLVFAQSLADHIIMLNNGSITVSGSTQDIAQAAGLGKIININISGFIPREILENIKTIPGILSPEYTFKHGVTDITAPTRIGSDLKVIENQIKQIFESKIDDLEIEMYSRPATLEESYLVLASQSDEK